MTNDEKLRLSEIIQESRQWRRYYPDYKRIEFRFVEFNSRLSHNEREVLIEPGSIDGGIHKLTPTDSDFSRLYKEWQEGWGIEYDGGRGTRVRVP